MISSSRDSKNIAQSPVVLVCGAGSIGRRHVQNLRHLGARVLLWRERSELLEGAAKEWGAEPVPELAQGIARADAVLVATATDRHMPVALAAADAGKAIFIEKPLSHSWDHVAELRRLVDDRQAVVEIGCFLRAHPNLRFMRAMVDEGRDGRLLTFRFVVGQRLDGWRPGSDYRDCYSADASRGGGALFDLVHEIDLAAWLCGRIESVYADLQKVSNLEISAEDLANLTVESSGGAVGQIQLDMLSPVLRRSFELVFEKAVYHWDYISGELSRQVANESKVVHRVPEGFERNDIFLGHMKYFLSRLVDPSLTPMCSIDDGIHILDVVLTARTSSEGGARYPLDHGEHH